MDDHSLQQNSMRMPFEFRNAAPPGILITSPMMLGSKNDSADEVSDSGNDGATDGS